ncbi:MAG: hypothetical protein AUK49_00870 [Betaproteobacteria bacterium CG2_30_68_42]|nr:MAG: hypothetical protein AUK49_00870 [Betaproteobacteria bacterium CG2_30_68_42]
MAGLSVIAAVAENGVIGAGNRLPWRLREDLAHFRALTWGHPVIMGRRTWESLGRPLPGRRNLVVSASGALRSPGAEVVPSLKAALAACGEDAAFVIGGAQLYAQALALAQHLHLTEIHAAFAGDTRFPDFDRSQWIERQRESHRSSDGLAFDFVLYDRRPPDPAT